MTVTFDPRASLILVNAHFDGPLKRVDVRLALDTASTWKVISRDALQTAGYDMDGLVDRVAIVTASSIESVARITLSTFEALGTSRRHFKVLAHTLLPSARVDGLLGLDFLRGRRVVIDFRNGVIRLS